MFYVINLKEDVQKRDFISAQMDAMGLHYTFVTGLRERRPIGIALSHLKILRNPDFKLPFVILEDDAQLFPERLKYSLSVPAETDAVYLGHSTFGVRNKDQYGLSWGKNHSARYAIYDEYFLRIYSMLARHAILYVSEKFRKNACKANEKALLNLEFPYPGDMAYEEIQKDHLILSPHQPWFYQSEKHKGNHPATRKSILDSVPPMEENI